MRAAFINSAWMTDPFTRESIPDSSPYYRQWLPMQTLPGDPVMGMTAWLGDRGFGIKTGPALANFNFDTISIKNEMHRWIPHQITEARKCGQRIIQDVDDLYDDIPEGNAARQRLDPEKDAATNIDHYREGLLRSDTLTVSTPTLLEHYEALGHDDVRLIRNGVNPSLFNYRKPTKGKPVLGWMGVVRMRLEDMAMLREWLPDFLEEHDLMFHHSGYTVGEETFAEYVGIDPERLTMAPMLPITYLHQGMQFDIGLVPLHDSPFNRAKSYLKGLEYACSGIPFVAQDLPEYEHLAQTGVGRTAHTPEDWVREVTALLDPDLRRFEARINHTVVLEKHTIAQRADEWREVFSPQRATLGT
jgi:hypothetical protein